MSILKTISSIYILALILIAFAHMFGLDLGATPHTYVSKDFLLPISFLATAVLVLITVYQGTKKNNFLSYLLIISFIVTDIVLICDFYETATNDNSLLFLAFKLLLTASLVVFSCYFVYKSIIKPL